MQSKQCVGVHAKKYKGNPNPNFMAKKKYSRRMKKIEPAVQTMTLQWLCPSFSGSDQTTTKFLDISQIACLLNRRFYRQGVNWAVSGMKFAFNRTAVGGQPLGTVTVSKLPDTWVMSNAWEKSFRVWQRMNNDALEEAESVRPRFLDYKIYADSAHHIAGFDANLLPVAFASPQATPGEWESSKIVIPQANGAFEGTVASSEFIAVGGSWPGPSPATGKDAVSLIEGYASSRALPNIADPNLPDDLDDTSGTNPENWMSAVFNDGTQQDQFVLDDMQQENNIAPYPFENDGANPDTMYPNGANQLNGLQIHDFDQVTGTSIGGMTRIKGGMFPCGLVRFDISNQTQLPAEDGDFYVTLLLELVPGNHRGYLCEPMTEM